MDVFRVGVYNSKREAVPALSTPWTREQPPLGAGRLSSDLPCLQCMHSGDSLHCTTKLVAREAMSLRPARRLLPCAPCHAARFKPQASRLISCCGSPVVRFSCSRRLESGREQEVACRIQFHNHGLWCASEMNPCARTDI
jgi:hypothetical protein